MRVAGTNSSAFVRAWMGPFFVFGWYVPRERGSGSAERTHAALFYLINNIQFEFKWKLDASLPRPLFFFFCCCLYGDARLERREVPHLEGNKLLANRSFCVFLALPIVMTERNHFCPFCTSNRFGECVQTST